MKTLNVREDLEGLYSETAIIWFPDEEDFGGEEEEDDD